MTATLINTEKSKRTRTNVKQSKFGCFTCKYDSSPTAYQSHHANSNNPEPDVSSATKQNLHVDDVGLQSASAKVIPKGPILIHRLRLHQRHQLYPCRPRLHFYLPPFNSACPSSSSYCDHPPFIASCRHHLTSTT